VFDAARGEPQPPYYVQFVFPEDLDEPDDSVAIYQGRPWRPASYCAHRDVRWARLEARARWDGENHERAVGYLIWQSDWTVVGGIDLIDRGNRPCADG
jgi:hypothetical protein